MNCITLDDDISFDQGSMSLVNPLTAIAMLQKAKSFGTSTVIHTAAASALGRMLNRYLPDNGVNIINIVRRKEQEELLRKEGANFVLNSTDKDFEEKLRNTAANLKAKLAYDAIGGEMTGILIKNMPKFSRVEVYGALSQK